MAKRIGASVRTVSKFELSVLGVAFGAVAAVGAQVPQFHITTRNDWRGNDVAVFVSDVDEDGYCDLVQVTGDYSSTRFVLRSGRDGAILREHSASRVFEHGDFLQGVDDFDRGGYRDFAWTFVSGESPRQWGTVEIRGGRTLRPIRQIVAQRVARTCEWRSAIGHDLNDDWRPDVVVHAMEGGTGWLRAFDHFGSLLWECVSPNPSFMRPGDVALIPDVTLDNTPDVIVAHRGDDGAAVRVHSGRDGTHVRTCLLDVGDRAGREGCVAYAGDLDADGVADFVGSTHGWRATGGFVLAFSGASGQRLWSGHVPDFPIGRSPYLRANVDVDLDGVPDVLVTTGSDGDAHEDFGVYALSGRDGSLLWRSRPTFDSAVDLGHRWLPTGAIDAAAGSDGLFPSIVVSEAYSKIVDAWRVPNELRSTSGDVPGWYPPTTIGAAVRHRLTVSSAIPAGMSTSGAGCAGALPRAPWIGVRAFTRGGTRIHLTRATAGGSAVLWLGGSATHLGATPLPHSLEAIGLTPCELRTSAELAVPVRVGDRGADVGYAFVDVPPLAGVTLHAQWWVPGAGATTAGGVSGLLTFPAR